MRYGRIAGTVDIRFIPYPVGYWYTYVAPHLYMLAHLEANPDLIKTTVYRDWVDGWTEISWAEVMDGGLPSAIYDAIRDHYTIGQWPMRLPKLLGS
jgi:hypothetical protein